MHLAEWQDCQIDQGCTYNLHAFNGLTGDLHLSYQYFRSGRRRWSGEIPTALATVRCTVNNPNGWEGGPGRLDRGSDCHADGSEIYALGRAVSTMYTSRP